MKVLILSQVFYPDVVAVAQYLTDFAIDLQKSGIDVKVLASRRGYDDRDLTYPLKERIEGIQVERIPSSYLGKRSYLARIIDALTFNLILIWKLVFLPRYDVVVGMTTPPLIATIGSLFCLFKGGKFIYWVMDLNPDEAVAAGVLKKTSLITRILEKISRFTFSKSDLIIALDKYMALRIEKKGIPSQKIKILPPWAHIDNLKYYPREHNLFHHRYQLQDKFVVMYSGNHSICHPLDTLLESALALQDEKEIVFMFIGGGERVKDVTEFKEKYGLSNIVQLPYQAFSELGYSLSAADLHVVVMGNQYVGIVHPSKIYDMLWMGRPFIFIGPKESHIGDLINKYKIGSQVQHGNVNEVVQQILRIKALKKGEREQIQLTSQKIAEENFSRKILSSQLTCWIRETKESS